MAKDIHNAAGYGNLKQVAEFVASGVKINQPGNNGITPLIMAARFHHNGVVQWLLAEGAQVDLADDRGRTPLMHAAQSRNIAGLKLLIKHGADPEHKDVDGETALSLAEWEKIDEVVEFLKSR
jgi:ankyrin repeat protein